MSDHAGCAFAPVPPGTLDSGHWCSYCFELR
jgi:hypothetical protein